MTWSLLNSEPQTDPGEGPRKALSERDAIQIWIARWLKIRPSVLVRRYGCDPRRLYEVWEETRFPGTRSAALALFRENYPQLVERIDTGPHRRIPNAPLPEQMALFSDEISAR